MRNFPCSRHALLLLLALLGGCAVRERHAAAPEPVASPLRILVFTRTSGWRHDSIPVAIETLRELGGEAGLQVEHSEDPMQFDADTLSRYRAVVFANTTLDVLDVAQQQAFERFVGAGGGYIGIHSAADTEYDWAWYGELVGARFDSHPPGLQASPLRFEAGHALAGTEGWQVRDELYNYRRNPRAHVDVIASADESTYAGGTMGADHPIAWCHTRLGGRAWYTGLGHDIPLYADPRFRAHLSRGLRYATGQSDDC
ncbi:ThuA domain-containing protein [Thermomonas carbonis]|uniref:ThuA domain-containing protein n=1 Tax=Thermomonas carbonis TaxID=1463158 RepID=UPI001E5F0F64|nr:ThuA domain-containing protein [Thermomonas carbonis]